MKNVTILGILIFCGMQMYATMFIMDLSTATDMNGQPIGYDATTMIMDSTFSEYWAYQYIYTNDALFMLSHLPSGNSWGGMSWEGFTLSRKTTSSNDPFECLAKGGVGGEGTPFVVGYYSDYQSKTDGFSSCHIIFNDYYYPQHIAVCQSANTYEAVTKGNAYANKFTDQDTLTLIISSIDRELKDVDTVKYYLAVDGQCNAAWQQIDLTTLGNVYGLSFRIQTTDMGQFGMNTPTYFALDALTVSSQPTTSIKNVNTTLTNTSKIFINGAIYIVRNQSYYTIDGRCIKESE